MKFSFCTLLVILASCNTSERPAARAPQEFGPFATRFLDAYWKTYPSAAISVGYGKYYADLAIPDSACFAGNVDFSRQWLDSLHAIDASRLLLNDRTSYLIIENELLRTIWRIDTLQDQHWDPSLYNIGGDANAILTQQYAPLDTRLRDLSAHLSHSREYYQAAFQILHEPTREHVQLAIDQNSGAKEVFGADLQDSIARSTLDEADRKILQQRIEESKSAISTYIDGLTALLADSTAEFRDLRLGKTLYDQKFKYEIVSDHSAEDIFQLAVERVGQCHKEMYRISVELWPKYCANMPQPTDSLLLIKEMIDRISLDHAAPADLFDTIHAQLARITHFIIEKGLFDLDTTASVKVRQMPPFASGVTIASAEFPLPYQAASSAYYNVTDLSVFPPMKVESALREYNNWMLQLLTIHEAIPGHCMQGIYTMRKAPDRVKAVFANGAMVEGWAVYSERMMMENGWDDGAPEMWLMYYKWNIRECANVIVDQGIHCRDWSEEQVRHLLVDEAFQEEAQVEEKYHRVTLSQVQLCSYFTGSVEILALRDAYAEKMGADYSLKAFHEAFLSQGTAPVKYIRQVMLKP